MAELMAAAGRPRPEIEDIGNAVVVRFRPSQYVPPQRIVHNLSERQRDILAILDLARSGLAFSDIMALLGNAYTEQQVRYDLQTLRTLGLTVSRGHGRGAKWERNRQLTANYLG